MKTRLTIIILMVAMALAAFPNSTSSEPVPALINSTEPDISSKNDSIFRRDGIIILGNVKEIGVTEIKYSNPDFDRDLLFALPKNQIRKIVFFDGKVQEFDVQADLSENMEQNSQELFLIQKKNALKIDFLSLATNTLSLTYERCLKPGNSLEFSLGVVGLGFADMEDNASGFLFRGGYKLIRSPEFFIRGMRYAHVMKGPYLKMEFDFATYGIDGNKDLFSSQREHYNLTKWALMLVVGKQWVFNDNFVTDLYWGAGIGSNNLEELDISYPYGFTTFGDGFPLAFSFGLRLGFLLKDKSTPAKSSVSGQK